MQSGLSGRYPLGVLPAPVSAPGPTGPAAWAAGGADEELLSLLAATALGRYVVAADEGALSVC
jgi:hypothetical protein